MASISDLENLLPVLRGSVPPKHASYRFVASAIALRQARSLWRLCRWYQEWDRGDAGIDEMGEPERIVVVAYQEPTALLLDSFRHFQRISDVSRYRLVLHHLDDPEQRRELEAEGIQVLICKSASPRKGSMLNWALTHPDLQNRSIAIYDSDSRPTALVGTAPHAVVQQPSLYTPPTSAGPFWQGAALNQTRWSCAEESHRSDRMTAWYSVSHGLSLPALREGWPKPVFREDLRVEDLEFGYRSRAHGTLHQTDRRSLDVADAPFLRSTFREQAARWFDGEIRALVSQHSPLRLANRWVGLVWWIAGPCVGIATGVIGARRRDRWVGVMLALALAFDRISLTILIRVRAHLGLPTPRGSSESSRYWLGFALKPALGQGAALSALRDRSARR